METFSKIIMGLFLFFLIFSFPCGIMGLSFLNKGMLIAGVFVLILGALFGLCAVCAAIESTK